MGYGLLWATGYGIRVTGYGLRVTGYGFEIRVVGGWRDNGVWLGCMI